MTKLSSFRKTHIEVRSILDYYAPFCPHCQGKMIKYDFQRISRISNIDIQGYPTLLAPPKKSASVQVMPVVLSWNEFSRNKGNFPSLHKISRQEKSSLFSTITDRKPLKATSTDTHGLFENVSKSSPLICQLAISLLLISFFQMPRLYWIDFTSSSTKDEL